MRPTTTTVRSSASNPLIKRIVTLREKRALRREEACCWVEGERELAMALRSGWELETLVGVVDAVLPESLLTYLSTPQLSAVIRVERSLWPKLVLRDSTESWGGIVRVPDRVELARQAVLAGQSCLVLDGVEKPGNIGAVLRSADAACVRVVWLCGDAVPDIGNPNLIRGSLGTVFSVLCVSASSEDVRDMLHEAGRRILAVTPDGAELWRPGQLQRDDVLVFGSESHGVSTLWREAAADRVALPMEGQANSLNIAQCATVLLYDQRWGQATRT